MASCLHYTGDADGALEQLALVLKSEPHNINALFNQGMIRWQAQHDAAGALASWEALLRTNPDLDAVSSSFRQLAGSIEGGNVSGEQFDFREFRFDRADRFEHASGVAMRTVDGDDIDYYAVKLFKQWGIGSKKSDHGVLILASINDRKYRTEVGYGLEPILPDGKVGGFGREAVPLFKDGNYSAALSGNATLRVTTDSLAVNGTRLPSGTYTIATASATLEGSGPSAAPPGVAEPAPSTTRVVSAAARASAERRVMDILLGFDRTRLYTQVTANS